MEKNNTKTILNEGVIQNVVKSLFGRNFKSTIAATSEGLLNVALTKVISGNKKFSIAALRKTSEYQKALIDLVSEASVVRHKMSFEDLAKSKNKDLAKKLVDDVQGSIEKEISNNAAAGKNLIDADVKTSYKNIENVRKQGGDVAVATKQYDIDVKLQTKAADAQKKLAGMTPQSVAQIKKLMESQAKVTTGSGTKIAAEVAEDVVVQTKTGIFKITKEQLKNFPGTIKKVVVNNKMLSTLAVAGLSVYALYQFFGANDNSSTILVDKDGNPIDDTKKVGNDWAECLNDMVYDKLAKVGVTTKGNPVVVANPTEKYPDGVVFYNNNRVQDVKTKAMGTWSCVGGKAVTSESVNDIVGRILKEKLLSEQIIDPTVAKHVKEMIDLLDFPVNQKNLKDAVNLIRPYVTNGKGKKFLEDYEKSGYADSSLKTTLDYVFISDTLSKQYRDQMYNYIEQIESGTENVSLPPTNTQTPLKRKSGGMNEETSVDIVWDKEKKKGDVNPIKTGGDGTIKKKKLGFKSHDCESKDFPLEFGCRSTKIGEVQRCLGVADDGKLGPKTMKAIEDNKYDTSRGLSKDVYDAILKACKPRNLEPVVSLKSKGLKMMDIASPKVDLDKLNKMIQVSAQPVDLYKRFKEEGWIVGDTNETTLEDGTVIPPTNRVKYKGPDLDETLLSQLDSVITGMGYDRIKQKLNKSYGDKYVWLKQ